jgi:hypothetical protein
MNDKHVMHDVLFKVFLLHKRDIKPIPEVRWQGDWHAKVLGWGNKMD